MATLVSDSLRDTLLELTMTYLLEQPTDMKDHAKKFFEGMEERRHGIICYEEEDSFSSLSEDSIPQAGSVTRRCTVYGDSYDPAADKDEFVKPIYPKTDEERVTLQRVAKKTLLFRALDEEQLVDVINAMFKRETRPGDVIIRQGDDGDNFYVIEEGYFEVFIKRKDEEEEDLVFTYENCGSFGELALLYNQPRAATVIAKTKGVIWALDRETFRKLVMQSAHEKRAMYEQFIRTIPLLSELDSYERLNLADVLVPRNFKKGEVIIQVGDEPDGMYFVERGAVTTKIDIEKIGEIELDKLKSGDYFGYLGLLSNEPSVLSAWAEEDTRLVFMDAESFYRLMVPCINVLRRNIGRYNRKIKKIVGAKESAVLIQAVEVNAV